MVAVFGRRQAYVATDAFETLYRRAPGTNSKAMYVYKQQERRCSTS